MARLILIGQVPYGLNQDEASAGYEAWSILNYGIDRHGISYPVHLIAWGSGQNIAYSWFCMPFIALFGLSEFTVRLPMALIGCVSVVLFYFFLDNVPLSRTIGNTFSLERFCLPYAPGIL